MLQEDSATRGLDDRITRFIQSNTRRTPCGATRLAPIDDGAFNKLALELFAHQFGRNELYRKYCVRLGRTPKETGRWEAIPAVPTEAFKELPLTCFPLEKADRVFVTSGTTAVGKHGKHYLPTLALYEASLKPCFEAHVLPDGARMRMLALASPAEATPTSSLGHMIEVVKREFGKPESAYYIGEKGLDFDGLARALKELQNSGEPVCLMGTAFAFVHFLDACKERVLRFSLPAGSRIMDTGGFKGKSREVSREELRGMYEDALGIPEDHVVNEYGMTELCSQAYDSILLESVDGVKSPRHKVAPPWMRTVVIDPETMQPAKKGQLGILRHFDLANRGSVMAVQTDDLGYETEGGFEVVGRVRGAEARGCSIAVDELLSASKGRSLD